MTAFLLIFRKVNKPLGYPTQLRQNLTMNTASSVLFLVFSDISHVNDRASVLNVGGDVRRLPRYPGLAPYMTLVMLLSPIDWLRVILRVILSFAMI